MLALLIFLLAVYGLANALAVLKIGCYIFGDPFDQLVLKDGRKVMWKRLTKTVDVVEVEDAHGEKEAYKKSDVDKIQRRRGLGRIPYVGAMFYCPACLSFWIGMAASAWVLSPSLQVCPVKWQAILMDGLMASAVSWLFHVTAMKLAHGVEDA